MTKVLRRELGRDQEIEASPTVNFARLDDVLVLVTPPGDEPGDPSSTIAPKTARAASASAK